MTVRVKRIAPIGLIVDLGNDREGLIREREIAWDAEARIGWRNRYQTGNLLHAVALKVENSGRPELSLRLAQADPWMDVRNRYPVGALVEGVVTGIMPFGVFIELEPGVTGLLHTSHFPIWEQRAPGEIFWPGDLVKVIVNSMNLARRRMGLSLTEVGQHRWQSRESTIPSPTTQNTTSVMVQAQRSLLQELLGRPRKRVVVVEDDPDQRQAVVDWLRHVNQEAEGAECGEDALEVVNRIQPDLVLMDVGLPGMNGMQAVERIQATRPDLRCVLMTDWGRAEHHAAELSALAETGVLLIMKPLLPEDLLNVLLETTTGVVLPQAKEQVRSKIQEISILPKHVQTSTLLDSLAQLQKAFEADKVVLFEFDPDGRRISIIAHQGPLALRQSTLPELIYTPIADVAEKGVPYVAEAARMESRLAHLESLLEFRACIGVPVLSSQRSRHALFLFFTVEMAFSKTWMTEIKLTAAAIGLWLERRQFAKQAADMLRVAMLGQLARAMVHEVSGRVTPVNLAVERLQATLDAIEHPVTYTPDQVSAQVQHARHELQTLLQQTQALTKTTRAFSRMARSGQEEIIVLEEIVDEAIEILRDAAKTNHVTVFVHPVPRLYLARAQVTYFQQALVNILQNAIQQISIFRPGQPGRIEVRLSQTVTAKKPLLQVKIEDDGPGIHHSLWDRIFEADYTTRPDGSGLGLYISRSLMESQGGRIYVDHSQVYWGSRFVVELPTKV